MCESPSLPDRLEGGAALLHIPVLIIGAGPAGCALALTLASSGIDCRVAGRVNHRPRQEGLSQRSVDLLDQLGLSRARECLAEPGLRAAHWGGDASAHNREYLVERDRFDRALADDLRARVSLIEGDVERLEWRDGIWLALAGGQKITTDFVVEARGRAAPSAREAPFRGPATLALGRMFQGPAGSTQTAIHPFSDGWIWLGRAKNGAIFVQFTIDGDEFSGKGPAGLAAHHVKLCMENAPVREWLAGAGDASAPVLARACGGYLSGDLARPHYLRIGDAACGLDPLSGQGVFMALAGAPSAAAVVRTCVERPDDAALAAQFHAMRVADQFQRKIVMAADFYAMETRWAERAFWRKRSSPPAVAPKAALVPYRDRRPVLDGGYIVEAEVLVTPDYPQGVWRLDDVPILPLLDRLRAGIAPRREWAAEFGGDPARLARAIDWLRQVGAVTL